MRPASLLLLLLVLFAAEEAAAQAGEGTATLTGWPPELHAATPDEETLYPYDVLPLLDTLALGYAYRVEEGRPAMDLSLAWMPGAYGVYDNRLVPADALPDDLRLTAILLRADVVSEGRAVAVFRLDLDDLALPPGPESYDFMLDAPTWDGLFEETSAAAARALFDAGFTLENLHIERAEFAEFREEGREVVVVPRFYPPRTGIWIGGDIYGPRPGKRTTVRKPQKPREGIGRRLPRTKETAGDDAAETADADRDDADARPTRRTNPDKPDRDDEDDDNELLPAALTGLALVGALAYAGGTAGYYGHSEAPFGLASGIVRARGGAFLQVAANEGVFGADEPERLVAKVMGFYRVFRAPVQPALGFGVLATEDGDEIELAPSVSVGGVLNLERFFFYSGYDFEARGVELSVAFTFRRSGLR